MTFLPYSWDLTLDSNLFIRPHSSKTIAINNIGVARKKSRIQEGLWCVHRNPPHVLNYIQLSIFALSTSITDRKPLPTVKYMFSQSVGAKVSFPTYLLIRSIPWIIVEASLTSSISMYLWPVIPEIPKHHSIFCIAGNAFGTHHYSSSCCRSVPFMLVSSFCVNHFRAML